MRNSMSVPRRPILIFAAALAYAGLPFTLFTPGSGYAAASAVLGAAGVQAGESPQRRPADWEHGFVSAVQAVEKSVVTITSSQAPQEEPVPPAAREAPRPLPRELPPPFDDSLRGFFEDGFLRRFLFDRPSRSGAGEQVLGSGVIVDDRGHILTNNHVVAGAGELAVWLADDRRLPAKVVGTDPGADLAVLKLEGKDLKNLRPARLGDSDALKVGQWVGAVGKPVAADEVTLTAGIVSAKGRAASAAAVEYEDLIQTDAAIGPAQSGGPLVSLGGEVVGITTAVRSRAAGNPAFGLAIPSNKAKQVLDQLVAGNRTAHGWLGIGVQEVDEGLAGSFGFDRSGGRGILVSDVAPDGPAAKAGLKNGDIIVRVDGKEAGDVRTFRNQVAGLKPGTKIAVEVWRGGKARNLDVQIGEAPAGAAPATADPGKSEGKQQRKPDAFGLSLADPTPQLRRRAGVGDDAAGAFITAVAPRSLAAALDLRPGDLILEVQDKAVRDAAEARAQIAKLDPAHGMRLRVRRGDVTRYVFLKLSS